MKKTLVLLASSLLLVACGGSSSGGGPDLGSATKIATYLEGKRLTMTGTDIPSHPNGFSEDVDYGAYSQCYASTVIDVAGNVWHVNSRTATITAGACDHVAAGTAAFNSNTVLIENVSAECFDLTVTYTGFAQEGRGRFQNDGKTLQLELYFSGQATGHRCADGAVGAATVTLGGHAFTGNAVQTYRITATPNT